MFAMVTIVTSISVVSICYCVIMSIMVSSSLLNERSWEALMLRCFANCSELNKDWRGRSAKESTGKLDDVTVQLKVLRQEGNDMKHSLTDLSSTNEDLEREVSKGKTKRAALAKHSRGPTPKKNSCSSIWMKAAA